jgi:hypothetical protein
MGVGSAFFTHRTAAASQMVIDQVEPQRPYEAAAPAALPAAPKNIAHAAKITSSLESAAR